MAHSVPPLKSAPNGHLQLLVERVVESPYFSRSARLRDMLLYLTGQVLRQGVTEIHEQEVGHRVFGRAPDYDTATDNTVRVHASTLRKRLEQFFSTEGSEEPIIIELPKGNYAPVFRERSVATELPAPKMIEETPPGLGSRERTGRRLLWLLASLAVILGASTAWLALSRPRPQTHDPFADKPAVREFWATLFRPGQATDLVLDDAAVGLYQELTGRTIGLPDYYDRSYLRGLDWPSAEQKLDRDVAGQLVLKRQSSFANILALWRLGQVAAASGSAARIVFARDYSLQALRSNNAVLLGNRLANPWVEPFEPAIGMRWQFDPAAQLYYPVDTWAPAASRDQFRQSLDKREVQDSYALVVRLPNLRGTGQLLLLSATGGSALSVAGEYLMNEASVRKLGSKLSGAPADQTFRSFEALLRIDSRSRRAEDVTLVICRSVTPRRE